jgi:hypothetical protein
MIPLPPKVKLYVGVFLAGLLASGTYWEKADALSGVPAWLPPVLAMLTFLEGFVTVPAGAAKKITDLTAKLGGLGVVALLAGYLAVTQPACKGINFPTLDAVEQVVLTDLETCGTSTACLEKMDADVAKLFNNPTVTLVDSVINDAITFLIDAGIIPANFMGEAKHLQGVKRLKLVSHATPAVDVPSDNVARTPGF